MGASNSMILEALLQLDPNNDAHWTSDDMPRLDVVKEILGSSASREEVTNAAPGFSRGTAAEYVAPADASEVLAVGEDPVLDGDLEAIEQPVLPVEAPSDLSEEEAIEAELAEARQGMDAAVARFNEARARMDALVVKRDQRNNVPLSVMVRQYHASVKKQRSILD